MLGRSRCLHTAIVNCNEFVTNTVGHTKKSFFLIIKPTNAHSKYTVVQFLLSPPTRFGVMAPYSES